ncbi:MAG: hypothetical protein LBJ63_01175 [Prevotellaceae bacterium]|jgi:hypothetical protein|nr:hypothetical protein [Prevotellaceae bacterium]
MKHQILTSFFMLLSLASCKITVEQKIKQAISHQIERYPNSTLQDIYKNFYQDYFGTEHAIPDKKAVEEYLLYELSVMQDVNYDTIIEKTGWRNNFVRVPLSLVKCGKISADELLLAFVESAVKVDTETADNWIAEWNVIVKILEEMHLDIEGFDNDKREIAELLIENPKMALHHSKKFNNSYHPHYRIVEKTIYENRLKKFAE